MEDAESDLFARAQELRVARDAEARAARRVAALVEAAMQLADARTLADLTETVISSGLRAIGAPGGAVAVLNDDGHLDLTASDTLGAVTQRDCARLPLAAPLPACVAVVTGRPVLLRDPQACQDFSPVTAEAVRTAGAQACVALPLHAGALAVGSLSFGWAQPQTFAPDEVEVLVAFAAQCSQALERIRTREAEQVAAAAVRRMSETMQRSLLTEPPRPNHLQIAVRYQPAAAEAHVGGDWYDAFVLPDGATLLVIGDVAGHDRDAAATMAQVRNVLRGVAHCIDGPPATVLSALDRTLRDLCVDALATAVLARVERPADADALGNRVLRWTNAGHPPPLLLLPDATVQVLQGEPDLLLGLDPDTGRRDHTVTLTPGSTLLLYTDGLIERRRASLDDGIGWLRGAVAEHGHLPLEQLCDAILAELQGTVEDDVALLALRAHPEDRPRPPGV